MRLLLISTARSFRRQVSLAMAVDSSFISNVFTASLVFVALWAVLYLFLKYKHSYWKRKGIPSVPGHWFFGNAKDAILMRSSPAKVFGDIYSQASANDDVVGLYILHKPYLLLRSPELVKQIFIRDFQFFSNRYFTAESLHDEIGSSSIFTLKNPKWKYLRTKLTPVFTSGKLKKLFHLMFESSETTKKYLDQVFSDGTKTKPIAIKEVAAKYTTDIISTVAFGVRVNSFDESNNQFFTKAQQAFRRTLRRGLQFFFMFFFPTISRYTGGAIFGESTDYFRRVFWDSMDSREASKAKRGDLIDFLVDLKNEKAEFEDFKLQGDVLVGQSAIFFLAGREATVTTICFTLYELAKHPDIQRRARDEVLKKIQTHGMTYEAVQEMKYLNQVVSEVLRFYPPAPLLDRVASQDYKVPGSDLVIEKGTPIYVALFGLHRDPKYFPDPMHFDPDRFSDENKDKIVPCTYMPFGEGPRNCIGLRMGLLQSTIAIVTILKDYEITIDPKNECIIDPRNIFIQPLDNFRLNLTKLNSI